MNETTKKLLILAGVFAALNGVLALKYFQTRQQAAEFADDSIIGKGKPVLLELGSHSCVPCKKMMPILDELNNEQTVFQVGFIDVWDEKEQGEKYHIKSIPVQIFFDAEGNELYRHVGFYPKDDILAKWNELGVTVP